MKKYTIEDLKKEVEGPMAKGIEEGMKEEKCPAYMLPLWQAGDWLGEKMTEEGATKKEEKYASFALGQRIMMSGMATSHQQAIDALERWRAGRPDKGGRELAEALIDGTA